MSLVPFPLAGMNKYKRITSRTNRKLKMSVGMYDNMYLRGPSFNRDRPTVLLDLFSPFEINAKVFINKNLFCYYIILLPVYPSVHASLLITIKQDSLNKSI